MGRSKALLPVVGLISGAMALQSGTGLESFQRYEVDNSKIELIGVCRASETEAECWGPDGGPAPDVEKVFKAQFEVSEQTTMPVRYGYKSRVAIVRISNPPYNKGKLYIGTYLNPGYAHTFNWPYMSTSNDTTRLETRAAVIYAGQSESSGALTTTISRTEPPSERMAVREGATIDYLGWTYTIRKIVKSRLDPVAYSQEGGTRWTIAMTAEHKQDLPMSVSWVPLDQDGLTIHAVDKDGNPVYVDPEMIANAPVVPLKTSLKETNAPKLFQARFTRGGSNVWGGDDYPIFTNINPAKIKAIYAYGSSTQKLTITGIPMDPKR